MGDEVWEWAKENRGMVDLIKHPNSGCMYDDHGPRAEWSGTEHTILRKEFPCNLPTSGCQDYLYVGPPACGCSLPLIDDAPEHSCKGCIVMGDLPPETVMSV